MKKIVSIAVTLLIVFTAYTFVGIPKTEASSISPSQQIINLAVGQRIYSSVTYKNTEDSTLELKLTAYAYNPETDTISDSKDNVFLKLDTDTFQVKANQSIDVKYEIYPPSNLKEGTYFNIVSITPVDQTTNISFKNSIAQLVVLNLVSSDNDVKGIITQDYTANISVVSKGIPYIKPAVIKYTIQNSTNYVIKPDGAITVSNERSDYKPYSFAVNPEDKTLYPGDSLDLTIEVKDFHFSDLIFNRKVVGHIYNGLDSTPKDITVTINSYRLEIIGAITGIIVIFALIKSLKKR